jgi:hypothetical protein
MDTVTAAAKKAAKKRRLREKRTATSKPETPITDSSDPTALDTPMSSIQQEEANYFYKRLRTTLTAKYAIVEPTSTPAPAPVHTDPDTSPAQSTNDDDYTVEKVDTKLLHMKQSWAKSRSSPFPESISRAVADWRLAVQRQDTEAAWDAVVQVCVVQAAELEKQEEGESEENEERGESEGEKQSEEKSERTIEKEEEIEKEIETEEGIDEKEWNEEDVANELMPFVPDPVPAVLDDPAPTAAITTSSTAAATENTATSTPQATNDDIDTVEKADVGLLRMEQHWAESRSGPFPEGIRDAMAHLRAELERREVEAA